MYNIFDKNKEVAHALKDFLHEDVEQAVVDNAHQNQLFVYMSDGWGADCNTSTAVRQGDHLVRRRGKFRHEFLLERGIHIVKPFGCDAKKRMLISPPRGLSAGKKGWNIFTAGHEYFPKLRVAGCEAISQQAYILDGQFFQGTTANWEAMHKLYHATTDPEILGPEAHILELTDWTWKIKCCSHGFSNAIRRGLDPYNSAETVEESFKVIRGLRDSSTDLMLKIEVFMVRRMRFREEPTGPVDDVMSLWRCLGIEGDMLDLYVECDMWYDAESDVLYVNKRISEHPEGFAKVSTCMFHAMRWFLFSLTRWFRAGPSSRFYTRSRALGVEGIVKIAQEDENVQHWYLNTFDHQNFEVNRFQAVTAIMSYPCESGHFELKEDGRCLRRAGDIWSVIEDELQYVRSLTPYVWRRLAQTVTPKGGGRTLKQITVRAAHRSVAYVWRENFAQLEREPLNITQNDIDANLDALEAQALPRKTQLTKDIKTLLHCGSTESFIVR